MDKLIEKIKIIRIELNEKKVNRKVYNYIDDIEELKKKLYNIRNNIIVV